MDIGSRVRSIRKSKNLTIGDLAEKAGVTNSMISQIERNICNPSLLLLRKVAEALDMPVWVLLYEEEEDSNELFLFRKNQRKIIALGENNQQLQAYLTPQTKQIHGRDHQLEIIYDEWVPGVDGGFMKHHGEEAVFVLSGELEAIIADKSAVLQEGDCLFYFADSPHCLKNAGSKPVKFLTIITPPDF